MSVFRLVLAMLLVACSVRAQTAPPKEALDGIDPVVLLTQGKEVSGKADLKVVRDKFVYLFATPENKAAFEKSPGKYEIQLGGACAKMGGAAGNAADFAVVDGKIYIFGSDDCHKKFVAAPAKYLPRPVAPMPTAARSLSDGRTLVERAVRAIGGAATLDAVTTYVESWSKVQKRPTGDVPLTETTMWKFPGGIRVDRTMTMPDRKATNTTLVTPDGGWFIGQGRAFPQSEEGRAEALRQNGRQLVPLLRARRDPGFTAAAVGAATLEGVQVDRVRVRNGLVDVTLAVEKASGLIHSVAFTGRGPDSEIGDFSIVMADYRDVGGLRLPFTERVLFNGVPNEFLSRTMEVVRINTPLDPALFQPGGGK